MPISQRLNVPRALNRDTPKTLTTLIIGSYKCSSRHFVETGSEPNKLDLDAKNASPKNGKDISKEI